MTANGWKKRMGTTMFFRREVRLLLDKIAAYFDEMGTEFNQNIRMEFFEITNSALLFEYSKFLKDRLTKKMLSRENKTNEDIESDEDDNSFASLPNDSFNINENDTNINVNPNADAMDESNDRSFISDQFQHETDQNGIEESECSIVDENQIHEMFDMNDKSLTDDDDNLTDTQSGFNAPIQTNLSPVYSTEPSQSNNVRDESADGLNAHDETNQNKIEESEFSVADENRTHEPLDINDEAVTNDNDADLTDSQYIATDLIQPNILTNTPAPNTSTSNAPATNQPNLSPGCLTRPSQSNNVRDNLADGLNAPDEHLESDSEGFSDQDEETEGHQNGQLQSNYNEYEQFIYNVCNVCQMEFQNKRDFHLHRKTHTYKCRICSEESNKPGLLAVHERTCKGGPKRFKCDKCDERFAFKYKLRKHRPIHEKPRQCEICEQEFPTIRCFNKHMERHVNKCDLCSQEFAKKKKLNKHMQSCHSAELPVQS